MKIKCIVIDDEPIARKVIVEYISEILFFELVGEGENVMMANELLQTKGADIMFLDINLPKISGIQFLQDSVIDPPLTIITTAYPEYALKGYELDIVDYLVKPISLDRFIKAVNKAMKRLTQKSSGSGASELEHVFVKNNNKIEKVKYSEILYAEALDNYVCIHTSNKKIVSYITLKSVMEQLPEERFLKVHKSFIINLSNITSIEEDQLYIGNKAIPISQSLKSEVIKKIVGTRLLKR